MDSRTKRVLACGLVAAGSLSPAPASFAAPQVPGEPLVTIHSLAVLGSSTDVEVQITASQPVRPQTHVLTGPDRLIIDFPNAVPSRDLHNVPVNRGEVKSVRVGLFTAKPPVTRVVLDLKTPQPYQLFPSGKTVIVKLSTGGKQAAGLPPQVPVAPPPPVSAAPPKKPDPKVEVEFQNGKLSIRTDKATLAEVLYEVQRRTGADIPIPAGAELEEVVANLGPAPARQVLAALLNGSRFNFIMVGSDEDPAKLKSVLLTLRGEGASPPTIYSPAQPGGRTAPQVPVQSDIPPEQSDRGDTPPPPH
jgi:hypothetical protein